MVERVCAGGGQLKIETNGHYLTPENCARLKDLGREGRPGEPRRRVARDVQPDARARRIRPRVDGIAQPAGRGRAHRDQLLARPLQRPRDRQRSRSRLRARRLQLLHRADDVHRQRREGLAPPRRSSDEQYETFFATLRAKSDRVSRPHARPFPRSGAARGVALPAATSGGAADRAAQRPGQADQRAALHLRRLAPRSRSPRSGPTSGAPGTIRAWRSSSTISPAIPGRHAGCTNGSTCDTLPRRPTASLPRHRLRQRLLRVCSLVRYRFFLYAGLLPYLLGAAWAYARRRRVRRPSSGAGFAGVVLSVIGVEAFNEYFDSRMGTDRVFNPDDLPPMSERVLWLGIAAFAGALAVGVYLTLRGGWPILAFALARRRGGDLLRGAADPLGVPRSGRARHRACPTARGWCWAASTSTRAALILGGAPRRRWCPRSSSWRSRWSTRSPTSIRIAWSASATSWCASADGAPSGSTSRSPAAGLAVVAIGVAAGVFPSSASPRCSPRRCWWRAGARALRTFETPRPFVPAVRGIVACYLVSRCCCSPAGVLSPAWPGAAHEPDRQLARAAAGLLAAHARLRPRAACTAAPSRRRASGWPTSSTPTRPCTSPPTSSPTSVPYVMLCGGEPLVVPHFFAVAEALGRAGVALKIETNGQRFDATAAERLAAPADPLDPDQPRWRHPGDLRAPAPRRLARQGACGLPRGARRRSPPRGHVRADAPEHRRGRRVIERARRAWAPSASIPAALMRIGTAARHWHRLEPSASAVRGVPGSCSTGQRASLAGTWNSATIPFDVADGLRASLADPPATLLVLAQRLGQSRRRRCPRSARTCAAQTLAEAWEAYRGAWAVIQ